MQAIEHIHPIIIHRLLPAYGPIHVLEADAAAPSHGRVRNEPLLKNVQRSGQAAASQEV